MGNVQAEEWLPVATCTIPRPRKTLNSPTPGHRNRSAWRSASCATTRASARTAGSEGTGPAPGRLLRNTYPLQPQASDLRPHPDHERRHDRAGEQPSGEAGDDPAAHTALPDPGEHADEAAEKDDVVQREDPPRSQQQAAQARRIHRLDQARHYVPHPTGKHRATGPCTCA